MGLEVMNIIDWIDKFCIVAVLLEIIMFIVDVILEQLGKRYRIKTFERLDDVLVDVLWVISKPMKIVPYLWLLVNIMALILH